MRIVWCTLQFLDYRIPVFEALSKIEDVELYLIFSGDINDKRIIEKTKAALGEHSIPLYGELSIGSAKTESFANSGFRLPYQKGLINKIKQINPDVLVSDGFFQWSYATLFLRATKGIPHVMCYERTMHTERNAQKVRKLYRKSVLKWIDCICCSGSLCEEYVRHLGFKKETTEGFMVADTGAFNQATSDTRVTKSPDKEINYLFVGQLIERKGLVELLKIWKNFSFNKRVKLTIIGAGVLENYLKEEIIKHNLESIDYKGRVNYNDIPDFYYKSDVFVLPTLEDNWSLVVPEAMAAGLPIITSIYNGCYPELVTRKNGWVMDPLDKNSFLNTLEESYTQRENLKQMGKESLEIIKKETPEKAAQAVHDACLIAFKKHNHVNE